MSKQVGLPVASVERAMDLLKDKML